MQLNIRKTILKNEERFQIDVFPKKTYKWPTGTWKDAQHHSSSGKYKSKPQWGIISHLSEWLLSKRQQTSVGEDVKKREPLCTAGGNRIDVATMETSMEITLWKPTNLQTKKLTEKPIRICRGYQGWGEGERGKWMKVVKRYTFPVIK